MNSLSRATAGKYRTLDAWRGVAALSVVFFHCTNTVLTTEMGWWAATLLHGWAGVFIFFPISGYCISAAVSRGENATLGGFLFRRWHRIAPPYWASLLVAVGAGLVAASFTGNSLGYLNLGVPKWISVITLTQGFLHIPKAISPVYWSLCYEEQFYIIMALTLLPPSRYRLRLLFALTALVVAYLGAWPAAFRIDGLFADYWLAFASGIALFAWLHQPRERAWALALVSLIAAGTVVSHDLGLEISAGVALILAICARFDETMAETRLGRLLCRFGLFSYSLYLVHVPIGGRVVNLLRRAPLPLLVPSLAAIGVSIIAGWCFYRVVERRFVNRLSRRLPGPLIAPAEPRVAVAI